MTCFVDKIYRTRVIQETTFGSDRSGSINSFVDVPVIEGTGEVTLDQPVQNPGHQQQLVDNMPLHVLMPKAAKYTFQCNLETLTTKATSTVAPAQHWLGLMLECAMGAKSLTTGTVITTGASTTVLPCSVVTTIHPGCAIACATGTGGTLECRETFNKSSSDISVKHALSGTPANSSTVYGSSTYYCNPYTTGAEFIGIQFICEGQNTVDRYILKGGWLDSMSLALAPGEIPRATFTWMFADWDRLDGSAASGDTTGDTLGFSTYTGVNTVILADSEYRTQTVGTHTIGSLIQASTLEWKPNIKFTPVKTPSGVNTIYQAVRVHAPPVLSGSFVVPYEDSQTWFDARDNRTKKAQFLQIGSSTATGAVLLSAPNTQITNVQKVDVDGVQGQRVEWIGRQDDDVAAETGFEGLAYSAFRIHFF